MSELNEGRWAVLSARGREASGLAYAKAAELVRELKGRALSGLCIVTDAAAARLPPARNDGAAPPADNNNAPQRPRRPSTGRKGKT